MDDILIFAATKEELKKATREVLKKLQDNDLYLKPEKCPFCQLKVDYLGMFVEQGKISMDPAKLRGILDWPTPTTVKEVRSFLGFGNYYRKFIKGYSTVAAPLHELLKADHKFLWTDECEKSFQDLKMAFTQEPVLQMPDTTKAFQIEADASIYASGAVLTQYDLNGRRHPVAFLSKTFNPTERRYEIYDRELLAIMRALREWRHYLHGNPHQTIIYSDHLNLQYFKQPQKLNDRQRRWIPELSQFDYKLIHMPGSRMTQSDALSRRPDHHPSEEEEKEEVTLLPDNVFINALCADTEGRIYDEELLTDLRRAAATDHEAVQTFEALQKIGSIQDGHRWKEWDIKMMGTEPVLRFRERIYVPDNLGLRRKIVSIYHDSPTAGHPGQQGTLVGLQHNYYWPGMTIFV